jgi:neutral amino acid transport system ATP-binding protein
MSTPTDPILAIEEVRKSFDGLQAVAGTSFSVARGSLTALIGPNGAGKTSLLDLVSGYEGPDAGAIRFEGRRIDGLAPHAIARRGIVRTFQLTRVFAAMSVRDNMLLGAPRQPGEALHRLVFEPARARQAETAAQAHAVELMRRFHLETKADDFAGTLSGGQRKLLEFARALMAQPRLVLLDEPMAGVNRTLGARLMDEIEALRRTEGMTFLFIEHDIDIVMRRADQVVVMAEGKVIAQGTPVQVRRDRGVIDAYLGRRGTAA